MATEGAYFDTLARSRVYEDAYLADTREALRSLILEIKAGKVDHLL
ncbi:hypothetical protein AB0H86_16055 [Streptomyces sp. NPDC050997]